MSPEVVEPTFQTFYPHVKMYAVNMCFFKNTKDLECSHTCKTAIVKCHKN